MISIEFDRSRKQTDALRVSRKRGPGVAILADVGNGLPFKDNSIEEIYLDHSLDDAPDFLSSMREIWRICRPGALVHVWLPHASSTWATSRNPGQRRPFTIETFDFFDPERNPDPPEGATFETEQARLSLTTLRLGQRPRLTGGVVASVVESLANRNRGAQYRWERWLAANIGFEEFYVLLAAVKPPTWAEP